MVGGEDYLGVLLFKVFRFAKRTNTRIITQRSKIWKIVWGDCYLKEMNIISGILQSVEGKPVLFFADRDTHEFNFATDIAYMPDTRNDVFFLEPENGFVHGKTHDGNNIAVYIGSERFMVLARQNLFTSTYVVSASNWEPEDISTFKGIRFTGHTLNSVFPSEYVRIYDNGELVIRPKDKCITHKIETQKYHIEMTINAPVTGEPGLDGLPNANTDVMVDLLFDEDQPLAAIFDHYNRMKELLSFMTYRNNVGFDGIQLIQNHPEHGFIVKTADVYILDELTLTDKSDRRNISFHDLGSCLPRLLKLFYDTEDRAPSYSLGFYPKSDQDIYRMTNSMLREICSGLECEIGFIPSLNGAEDPLLTSLIESVRREIKSFRKANEGLSNDTYNLIYSSVSTWSFPLAEKLIALYHTYEDEMRKVNKSRFIICDSDIKAFVKYRNDITHGRHRILDERIAVTAHVLAGLVYCCLLKRIGMERSQIFDLCKCGKIVC